MQKSGAVCTVDQPCRIVQSAPFSWIFLGLQRLNLLFGTTGLFAKEGEIQRRMRKYKAGAYTEIMSELENRAETPSLSLSRLISLLKNGKIQAVWIDIDQTLLSFDLCARDAMIYAFQKFGIEWTEAYYPIFLRENACLWDHIESGEMTRDEMRKTRFVHLFKAFGLERTVPEGFEETFHHQLYEGNHPMPKALEGLEALKTAGLPLFIVTNGKQSGQYKRLKVAGMDTLFTEIYTSDEFGVSKPDLSYFQKAYARTCKALGKTLLPDEILVIGDSWKADILGAIAFGAPSLWIRVNRQHDPFEKESHPTVCEIHDWNEFLQAWQDAGH